MRKVVLAALLAAGCAAPEGNNAEEKRDFVLRMSDDVVKMFREKEPEVNAELDACAGYAAFSNTSVTFLFAGGGGGYGLATHRESGKRTFMRARSGNVGFGLGAKEYRLLMVFQTEKAFQTFLQGDWTFGTDADATAKSDDQGGAAEASARVGADVEVYTMTESGAILAATLQGGVFERDDELN